MFPKINLSLKEKRELYKAFRSAHDGICPCCGSDTVSDMVFDAYTCIYCDFQLSKEEVKIIKRWRGEFHDNLQEVLKIFREQLNV